MEEINQGHYHEIIDRVHVICSMIDDFLIEHPAMDDEMKYLCEEAQIRLCKVSSIACGKMDIPACMHKWEDADPEVCIGGKVCRKCLVIMPK